VSPWHWNVAGFHYDRSSATAYYNAHMTDKKPEPAPPNGSDNADHGADSRLTRNPKSKCLNARGGSSD
jgi:hypothetical protein